MTAAHFIRQADPSARIEIYSEDPNAAYYRAALTNYLIGELREAQLFAIAPDFFRVHNVQRIHGRVLAVDGRNSRLTLADGSQIAYDQLLIAAGARPNPPGFPGIELAGVMTMRTLQDARTVMDLASSKRLRQAVVVGGGLLGIEWVQGLLRHRVKVIYLLRGEKFFEKVLDQTASDLVISRLRAAGVDVRINEEIGEALAGKGGRVRAVRLKNSGEEIECQLVGAAIGIRPNVEFLDGSGIDVAVDQKRGIMQGIKVDEYLRTNISNVYAAGDIIHNTLGLWEVARLQGRAAGRNMAGGSETVHQRNHYHATRLYDLDFASVGDVVEKPGDQVLIDLPRGSGRVVYRKLIVRENRLIGATLLGERKERVRKYGQHYRKLIEDGIDVSAVSKNLLDPSFDLAAWMHTLEVGDQIKVARRIPVQTSIPSIADMRKTRHGLDARLSDDLQIPDALLQKDGESIPLKSVMRIGRLPENDLALDDLGVSGQHAQIRWQGSAFVLEDLGSRNGTLLDGARMATPSRLTNGALIQVGATQLRFVLASAEKSAQTSTGLPEAPAMPIALPSDPVWGTLQIGERDIALQVSSLNIGRDAQTDIPLDDPTVSYIHAQIVLQGTDPYLRDLGSSNGTYVNEGLITVPHLLQDGDVLKLGATSLIYRAGQVSGVTVQSPIPSHLLEDNASMDVPGGMSIIARAGPMLGLSFALKDSPVIFGRDPASNIVLHDQSASWQHASFNKQEMRWFVKDLNSSNGTWLNDERLEADRLYPIQAADRLRLGDTLLEVTQDAG
jgi:pSer/pThr/pTyr-binding forkhead associated (FHA) protein/NADPH-dependent 2,4-dienoyl-CoA reductase/sulfur reductase-like enzyme